MEELVSIITQSLSGDVTPEQNQFFIDSAQSEELGQAIIEFLSSDAPVASEPKFIETILGLLKTWFSIHWRNIPYELKQFFFNLLQELIKRNNAIASYAGAFLYIVDKENENRDLYENFVFELFSILENFASRPISALSSYAMLMYSILRKYRASYPQADESNFLEFSLVSTKFAASVCPLFSEESLITSAEGLETLKYCLKSLECILKRRPSQDLFEVCINFNTQIITHFIEGAITLEQFPTFTGFCFKNMLRLLDMQAFQEMDASCEIQQQFFELAINALSHSIENFKNNSYLISAILLVINLLCLDLERPFLQEDASMLELFIHAAELSESDVTEAQTIPNSFLEKAYPEPNSRMEKCETLLPAVTIINYMVKKSPVIATAIFDIPYSEVFCRIFARCANTLCSKYALTEQLVEFLTPAFSSLPDDDELLIASTLYLMSHVAIHFDEATRTQFMELAVSLLDKERIVISANACQLIETLVKLGVPPIDESIEPIIELIPEMVTDHVINALRAISQKYPQMLQPHAEAIIGEILEFLETNLESYGEDDDFDTNYEQQLNLLGSLITSTSGALVNENLVAYIQHALSQENGDIFGEISYICSQITCYESPEAINIVTSILQSMTSNQSALGFAGTLSRPILQFISAHAANLPSFGISETLISFVMENMPEDPEDIQVLGDIIVWVLSADIEVDASSSIEFAGLTLGADGIPEPLQIAALQIFAILSITRDFEIVEQHIAMIAEKMQNHKTLRRTEKRLFTLFLLKHISNGVSPDELMPIVVTANSSNNEGATGEEEAHGEEEDEELSDDSFDFFDRLGESNEYSFDAPFEKTPISQYRNTAISKCSHELIATLQQSHPDFFNLP